MRLVEHDMFGAVNILLRLSLSDPNWSNIPTNVTTDETRPSCNRCKKAGYECQGYNRVTVFVDETDWVQSKHGIDRLISDIASDNSSPRTASSTANPAKGQNLTDISLNRSLQQLASALSNNPNQDITRDVLGFIEGVILEGALSSNFWSYTPSSDVAETDNRPGSKSEQQNLTGGLVSSRRGGGSITKRLFLPRMIVHAIALTLYGGKSGDALSVTQAAQLYGYAVRQVGSDLRKPNLSSNQTILLSILNLGLYDVCEHFLFLPPFRGPSILVPVLRHIQLIFVFPRKIVDSIDRYVSMATSYEGFRIFDRNEGSKRMGPRHRCEDIYAG